MDFVVAGYGTGALLTLAGLLLQEHGAFWSRSSRSGAIAGGGKARAAGRVFALGGVVLVLATTIALFLAPSDRAGTLLVGVALILVVGGVVARVWLMTRRFGAASGAARSRTAHAATRAVRAPEEALHSEVWDDSARPVPALEDSPANEEFDPAMTPIDTLFDPGHRVASVIFDDRILVGTDQLSPQQAKELETDPGCNGDPESAVLPGLDDNQPVLHPKSREQMGNSEELDRVAAFAPIPLFREQDRAAHQRARIVAEEETAVRDRPLPWETPTPEHDFFVDASANGGSTDDEDCASRPPIPFVRPVSRR